MRKYIKNRPRIFGVMISPGDQQKAGLTAKDLLTRPDAVQLAKIPETPITTTTQTVPSSAPGKVNNPAPVKRKGD